MSEIILVFMERADGDCISSKSLRALSAARQLAEIEEKSVVICGEAPLESELSQFGHNVLLLPAVASEDGVAERYADLLEAAVRATNAQTVLLAASAVGRDFAPRLAVKFDAACMTDICGFIKESETYFLHPMWAGRLYAKQVARTEFRVVTVRATEFAPAQKIANTVEITRISPQLAETKAHRVSCAVPQKDRPNLTEASIVVSGGRGCGDKSGFENLVFQLADTLGAAVGATRAVVDLGYIHNEAQVGQTGQSVAPEIYFALGISGAVQHTAGIRSAGLIVAINSDPDAPIFEIADLGLCADVHTAVPELCKLLAK